MENDDGMIHYILKKQCCANNDSFDLPLMYNVNGHNLHFGLCEFCLVTGFKFGMVSFCEYRNGDILFRNWLFLEKIRNGVKIIDVLALIEDEEKFSKVNGDDAIRLCLLLSLEGEHIWRQFYDSIRNVSSKHKLDHLDGLKKNLNHVLSYSLSGFLFAFKIVAGPKYQNWCLEEKIHVVLKETSVFEKENIDLAKLAHTLVTSHDCYCRLLIPLLPASGKFIFGALITCKPSGHCQGSRTGYTNSSHEKEKKDVSTLSLEEVIAWEQEETQSPSYLRSPHVWKKLHRPLAKL
nr:phospholipase-like, aminotransferase-like mobile domain protein [Tanacetum cinerariifolium]